MAEFDGDMSSKTYIKVPKFNGKDKKFPVWKKQMTSFLSQAGCGALIAACPGVPQVMLTTAERMKLQQDL